MGIGEARAKRDAVMMARAMAVLRDVDQMDLTALGVADLGAGLKVAAVPRDVVPTGAAPVTVDRKVAGLTAAVDLMVLLLVVLVDRERVDPMAVLVVGPMGAQVVDREAPIVAVPAAADAVPTNMVPALWPGEWMRSTTSWIGYSKKLNR